MSKFAEIFDDITKQGTKIPTNRYLEYGTYPIIDQGHSEIAGYTNEVNGLFTDVPAIIFGDHTRIIKYVETPCFLGADGVKLLKAKDTIANYKYLYYALCNADIPNTGYNRHFKWLKEVDIPDYPADEQNTIVAQLEKIDGLVALRKQQLSKLDELVKSRFIEMFDSKGYPIKTLAHVVIGSGEYGAQSASTKYDATRPRYVRITDINDDGTLNDDIVSSINTGDDNQYKLFYGDFLFARMGATVGKTYAFMEGNQIFAGYLIRYKLNMKLIIPSYLFWYTKTDDYANWVKLNQSGAAQPGINAKKYGTLSFPLPPIELQNQFADFVKIVDKSKIEIQKSLERLETLKKALMQKYFG